MPTSTARMSAEELEQGLANGFDQEAPYRAISRAAVASLVFAIIGLFALWASVFIILPFLGLCFAVVARSNLKRYPDELTGKTPAAIGLLLNAVLLVASLGTHSYVYATEVPPGYQRISFGDLKPKPRISSLPYSPKAEELAGTKVFLKGYVRPSDKKKNLHKFILVGDFGQCCFGGSPKITDVVAVDIVIDKTVDYGLGLRKIGGTFRFNPRPVAVGEKDVPGVYYQIEADFLQ